MDRTPVRSVSPGGGDPNVDPGFMRNEAFVRVHPSHKGTNYKKKPKKKKKKVRKRPGSPNTGRGSPRGFIKVDE